MTDAYRHRERRLREEEHAERQRRRQGEVETVPDFLRSIGAGTSGVSSATADPGWSCVRKHVYPSEAIARSVARGINRRDAYQAVRPYACLHCGGWHVGRASAPAA